VDMEAAHVNHSSLAHSIYNDPPKYRIGIPRSHCSILYITLLSARVLIVHEDVRLVFKIRVIFVLALCWLRRV
jgi:hypothetical protein